MPSPIFTNGADVLAEIFHSAPRALRESRYGVQLFNYKSQINSKFCYIR